MCTVSRAWPSLSAAQEMLRTWEGVAKQTGCENRVKRFSLKLHVCREKKQSENTTHCV